MKHLTIDILIKIKNKQEYLTTTNLTLLLLHSSQCDKKGIKIVCIITYMPRKSKAIHQLKLISVM